MLSCPRNLSIKFSCLEEIWLHSRIVYESRLLSFKWGPFIAKLFMAPKLERIVIWIQDWYLLQWKIMRAICFNCYHLLILVFQLYFVLNQESKAFHKYLIRLTRKFYLHQMWFVHFQSTVKSGVYRTFILELFRHYPHWKISFILRWYKKVDYYFAAFVSRPMCGYILFLWILDLLILD